VPRDYRKRRAVPRDTAEFGALPPRFAAVWGRHCDRMGAVVLIAVTGVRPLSTPPCDTKEEMFAPCKAQFAELYP